MKNHLNEQECLNRLNKSLSSFNLPAYKTIEDVNIEYLQKYRSNASTILNSQFTERNIIIAGYCGNTWMKTVYCGLYYNLIYKLIYSYSSTPQGKEDAKTFFSKYEPYLRVGIFGIGLIGSYISRPIMQWIVKHGVKLTDRLLSYFLEPDSTKKQFFGSLIMAIVTVKLTGFYGPFSQFYEGYNIYKGYRENSEFFQKDLNELQKSINLIQNLNITKL